MKGECLSWQGAQGAASPPPSWRREGRQKAKQLSCSDSIFFFFVKASWEANSAILPLQNE
jgi:hypothetical protein